MDVMKSWALVVPPGTVPAARHMNNDTAEPSATRPRVLSQKCERQAWDSAKVGSQVT
jgi:hypothetical protein